MRLIRFRAKADYNGEWVHGDLIQSKGKAFIRTQEGAQFLVDKETVGQYTGLLAKADMQIYEGDVLQFPSFEIAGETIPESNAVAVWGDGGWEMQHPECSYQDILDQQAASGAAIIGNRWDHPELLEIGEEQR